MNLTDREIAKIEENISKKGYNGVLREVYDNMDCTIVFDDGSRPLMTNCFLYEYFLAIINYCLLHAEPTEEIVELTNLINERIQTNIDFEKENPPIVYKKEKVKKKTAKTGKYTHKDMFTGETVDDTPKIKKSKSKREKVKIDINFKPIFNFGKK